MESYKVLIDSAIWTCEPNLVGCSMLYRYLIKNGHTITHDPSQADFIIINSCGFLKETEDKSLNLFQKYYSLKKKHAAIIMYGCLVKINEKQVASLDLIAIGYDETSKLDQIFCRTNKFDAVQPYCDEQIKKTLLVGKQPYKFAENIPFLLSKIFIYFIKKVRINYEKMIRHITYLNKTFVLIGTGCTGKCSYCVIKKAKGNIHSRKIEYILADIKNIYGPTKNIFLVAEDCGCYGVDIGTNLIELLYEINKRYPNLSIDINNINPVWLEKQPNEYIKMFQDINIEFALIPIQSGSNKIITQMNRSYDPNNVVKIIDKIRKASPRTFMYTHFIIGFPGESTIDFLKTLSAARHFDYPVPFGYYGRKGTVSATLPHQKSSASISLRYCLFILFINFVILYKLLTGPQETSLKR
ncbi:MAG: radical SAM protein [Euryarchaeota archaeon]|nr:radical SAM protein [Euryarchaeota archaeon]